MQTKKNTQSKSKTFSSFSAMTLLKLAQLEADKSHNGELTILVAGGEFKCLFGQGAPSQAAGVAAHDSLKLALVSLLVESPVFDAEFVSELPIQ